MKLDYTKLSQTIKCLIYSGTFTVLDKPMRVRVDGGKYRFVYILHKKSGDCYSRIGELIGVLNCDVFLV